MAEMIPGRFRSGILFAIIEPKSIRFIRDAHDAEVLQSKRRFRREVLMNDRPTPPWADEMPEGAFLSPGATYVCGRYFDRYERDCYVRKQPRNASAFQTSDTAVQSMNYFFYDPTKHGYPRGKEYPLLIFLHGTGNSLVGDVCISYAGAEYYASENYQQDLGGAYILVPVANEYRDEDGKTKGYWSDEYVEPLYELINDFVEKHTNGVGKKFLIGNSSGAYFTFIMANRYLGFFDCLIPVGSAYIPEDEKLDAYDAAGIHLFYAYGKRDEFHSFEAEVAPRLDRLRAMKHCFLYTPEWVYNGDHGIATIYGGTEMGQHCLINAVQANLMFDDGTPMEVRLPRGLTGWIAGVNDGTSRRSLKAVLFDLDGTLIDTEKIYRQIWPKTMAGLGYTMTDDQYLEMRSLGRPYAPARFREWFGADFDYDGARRIRKQYFDDYIAEHGMQRKAGAMELLSYLRSRGVITAIVTATDPDRATEYLKRTGLADYVDRLISATMVDEGKPSPKVYLYACEQLGLAPSECVAVEDAPNGIRSARRAGIDVIMVPDQSEPDEEISRLLTAKMTRLDEIIGWLEANRLAGEV